MLFNSYAFIFFFLPATFLLYFLLNRRKLTTAAKASLTAASLFFYGYWNFIYLPLIMGSILFNYAVGSALNKVREKRSVLIVGIAGNLGLLAYFKYMDFFLANINTIAGTEIPLLHIVLPLGISFFTFTQIAYLVDTARGAAKEYSFLNYVLFVTFFPHLLAGPIIHHKEMMPQFDARRNKIVNYRNIAEGLALFFIGLFKKVIIADTIAAWANSGFDTASSLTIVEAWATSLAYTLQLYFDFSGYTDMALGSSLLFNIKLPQNFNSPYKATTIQDFWRRWHMTLSRFVRDYIYIPLGGNRVRESRILLNILITFFLMGLWHGAGWTFVAWGLLHGIALVVYRLWQRQPFRLPGVVSWLITFLFVNGAWVFFRAKSFPDAMKVLKGMCGMTGITLPQSFSPLFAGKEGVSFGRVLNNVTGDERLIYFFIIFLMLSIFFKNSDELVGQARPTGWSSAVVAIAAVYAVLNLNKISQFLYFQF